MKFYFPLSLALIQLMLRKFYIAIKHRYFPIRLSCSYLSLKNCRKLKYGTYYYYCYYTHSHPMYHQAIVFSQCQLQKPLRLRHGRHLKKDIFAKKTFNFLVSDKAVTHKPCSYLVILIFYTYIQTGKMWENDRLLQIY